MHLSSGRGRQALSPWLIAGLLYLQHAFDASDEAGVNTWVENPSQDIHRFRAVCCFEPAKSTPMLTKISNAALKVRRGNRALEESHGRRRTREGDVQISNAVRLGCRLCGKLALLLPIGGSAASGGPRGLATILKIPSARCRARRRARRDHIDVPLLARLQPIRSPCPTRLLLAAFRPSP